MPVTISTTHQPATKLGRQPFEPVCFDVKARQTALDKAKPDWGERPYYNIILRNEGLSLSQAPTRLDVLIPCSTATSTMILARMT